MTSAPAPELQVSHWLNAPKPFTLADFRGRVLVIEAFQMLCPGCVSHGLPQAQRVAHLFPASEVAVIGLHTVFEHHDVQGTEAALSAFLHEYRFSFPVGIDMQNGRLPMTMSAYAMKGTPTTVIIDRRGNLRFQHFGQIDDLMFGQILGVLMSETHSQSEQAQSCDDGACPVPAESS